MDITTSKPAAVGARYRMPPVQTKVEGRGGATKTVVVNCAAIASALRTESSYIMKFLSLDLGAALSGGGIHALKGNRPAADLQQTLKKFIDRIIVCRTCRLPELRMTIDGSDLRVTCTACPASYSIDDNHKIVSFIVKNPPKRKDRSTADSSKTDDVGAMADDEAAGRTTSISTESTTDWHSDTSAAAAALRWQEEIADTKTADPVSTLHAFVRQQPPPSADAVLTEWKRLVKTSDRLAILLRLLLDLDDGMRLPSVAARIKEPTTAGIFRSLPASDLLKTFENLAVPTSKLIDYTPHVLHALYDIDVLSEDVLLAWYGADPNQSIQRKAKPFIDWLKTADVEE